MWKFTVHVLLKSGFENFEHYFTSTSDQISRSVVSDSLRPHESQHARSPCPSPTPGVHSDSHPSSQWCHPVISSSVVPFSSCPQSLPASGSFQMSQLFASSGQNIGVSASASVLRMNIQDWFPLRWTGWISLQSKGLSRVFSNTTVQKHQFFGPQPSLWSSSHIRTWLLEMTNSFVLIQSCSHEWISIKDYYKYPLLGDPFPCAFQKILLYAHHHFSSKFSCGPPRPFIFTIRTEMLCCWKSV